MIFTIDYESIQKIASIYRIPRRTRKLLNTREFLHRQIGMEQAIDVMDTIYSQFVKIRLSPEWKTRELPSLLEWIREGI